MKRKAAVLTFIVVICLVAEAFTVLHTSGEIFVTGSPYDGATCAQCHSGGATTPTVSVSAIPSFGVGNTYVAGQTYTITVNCSGSYPKYGFDAEILNSNSSVTVADAGICGPALTPNCSKSVTNPTNYHHNVPSGAGNATSFSFLWTAPSSGNVFIYVSGLGVNFNNTTGGDKVATTSLVLVQDLTGISSEGQEKNRMQLFPNPAKEEITLTYFLERASEVKVGLYTAQGQCKAELLQELQTAGRHITEIKLPDGLARGLYFVKLCVNNTMVSERLIIH